MGGIYHELILEKLDSKEIKGGGVMGTLFARFYDTFMYPLEKWKFRNIRKQIVRNANGKVLEIGSGTGANFPFYVHASEVIAIEPDPFMRTKSLEKVRESLVPIDVRAGNAEDLPFEDDTFDTVIGTLVLCTIPDPKKALQEIRRVCRQGGRIQFFEPCPRQPFVIRKISGLVNPNVEASL